MFRGRPFAEVPMSVLSKVPFAVPSPGRATPIPKVRPVSVTPWRAEIAPPLNVVPAGKTPPPAPVTVVWLWASVGRANRDTAIASSGIAHQTVRLVIVFTPLLRHRWWPWLPLAIRLLKSLDSAPMRESQLLSRVGEYHLSFPARQASVWCIATRGRQPEGAADVVP